jgi:CRP-like cAMP-binding protein
VGDLLGEMALLDDRPRSATAVALEPTSCLLITRANFQSLLRKDPEIGWCVVPVLAGRLRDLEERLLEREEERGGEVVPAAPRAPEAEEAEEEKEEADAVLHLLRIQYAAIEAAAAGITGAARVVETFLDVLASKTELDDQRRVRDLLRDLPRGVAAAAESALDEGEKLPEQVLSRFRWNRTRGDDS